MSNLQQLEAALIAADKAGNEEDARMLAAEIKKRSTRTEDGGFSFSKMVGNIPQSAGKYVSDIASAITSPVDTLKALGNTVAEGFTSFPPGEGAKKRADLLGVDPEFPHFKGMAGAIDARYGSVGNALNTLETDPVGALADVSGVMAGTGALTGAKGLTKAGMAIDPVNIALNTGRAGAKALTPAELPSRIWSGAAKLGYSTDAAKQQKMIQTALDAGIRPTRAGLRKLNNLIDAKNSQLEKLIAEARVGGNRVPAARVMKYLRDVRKDLGGFKVEGASDLSKIDDVAKAFNEHIKAKGINTVSVDDLQAFKRDAWDRIKWEPGRQEIPKAKQDAYKAMGRAAKEEIERLAPGVKGVNRELGDLLQLHTPNKGVGLAQSAQRNQGRFPVSFYTPTGATAGALMTPDNPLVGALLGGVAGQMATSPALQSQLAIALNRAKQSSYPGMFANNNLLPFAVRQGLLQSGRLEDAIGQ